MPPLSKKKKRVEEVLTLNQMEFDFNASVLNDNLNPGNWRW